MNKHSLIVKQRKECCDATQIRAATKTTMSQNNSYNTQGAEGTPNPQGVTNAQEASAPTGGYAERPQLNPYPGPGAIPATQNPGDLPMKRSQGKAIIILLVCILALNAAALVLQFANPFAARFGSGSPRVVMNGTPPTNGEDAPAFNGDAGEGAPTFSEEGGNAS
jgi:hypothetical protein